jgi:hypothetical protein
MSKEPLERPRKESPGAKKKEDRLVEEPVELHLSERLSKMMTCWVQPSLRDAFYRACQKTGPYPLAPSDVLRQLMLDYVQKHPSFDTESRILK